MRPSTFPACLRHAGLAVLASLAAAAWAEPLSTTVTIPDGDLAAARSDAVRELLWEAGMRGNAVVQTQSALIGGDLHETTLVRSSFRVRKFSILREEVVDGRLHLSAEIEREDVATAGCTAALPLQNIAFAWQGVVGEAASSADEQAGAVLGAAIAEELRTRAAPYLQEAGPGRAEAMYRIVGALEPDRGVLSLQLRAAPVDRLIREIRLPTGSASLARQEDTNLGYALLRQWVPTAASRQLAADAAQQLDEAIRCLPAVLRIPPLAADGGFRLGARFPLDFSQRGLVLFFSAWPVGTDGAVDLLQADGYLKPEAEDARSVRFPGSARLPGRKHPTAGGYLIVP